LKLKEQVNNLKNTFKLRAYLWGIETHIFLLISFPWVVRCEPTYEELKPYIVFFSSKGFEELRAYLWGIETDGPVMKAAHLSKVASLPMRNWNLYWTSGTKPARPRCEPTYEELKQVWEAGFSPWASSVASLPMRNWNFYKFNYRFEGLTRCEPTYEELKQIFFSSSYIYQLGLRAYLWGIETFFSSSSFLSLSCVASLPMRNWNKSNSKNNQNLLPGCEPTYEELKLGRIYHELLLKTTLRAYLWGIETSCSAWYSAVGVWVASLPMRNWNPCIALSLSHSIRCCEPTYEELKHINCYIFCSWGIFVASLPMRNWNFLSSPE